MNGVSRAGISRGLPATAVVKLAGDRLLSAQERQGVAKDELLMISVTHPPRIGQPRPIAALMPQVLAKYGLTEGADNQSTDSVALDVLA